MPRKHLSNGPVILSQLEPRELIATQFQTSNNKTWYSLRHFLLHPHVHPLCHAAMFSPHNYFYQSVESRPTCTEAFVCPPSVSKAQTALIKAQQVVPLCSEAYFFKAHQHLVPSHLMAQKQTRVFRRSNFRMAVQRSFKRSQEKFCCPFIKATRMLANVKINSFRTLETTQRLATNKNLLDDPAIPTEV